MINKLFAVTALAVIAASAQAAEPAYKAAEPAPFYGGVDVGITELPRGDHTRTSFGGYLGYNINKNFAVEAGYRRLFSEEAWGVKSHADQASLSLVATQPLTETLSVYGRLGVSRLTEKGTIDGIYDFTEHKTRVLPGIGLSYKLNEKVSARVEVQRPSSNTHNVSTGISYAF
jgi:OOP family OmpA-OmpF porin